MSENNGTPASIGETADALFASLQKRRENLLGDLKPSFPAIRRFLTGHTIGDRVYPGGKLSIETDSADCVVRIAIPLLGIEAQYRDTSGLSLLERLENDLDLETVPWDHSWEVKKKFREQQRKRIGLS